MGQSDTTQEVKKAWHLVMMHSLLDWNNDWIFEEPHHHLPAPSHPLDQESSFWFSLVFIQFTLGDSCHYKAVLKSAIKKQSIILYVD